MARFFNALVVFSATTSLSSCGGRATDPKGDHLSRAEPGSGGTGVGSGQQASHSGGSPFITPIGVGSGGTEAAGGVGSTAGGSLSSSGGARTGGENTGGGSALGGFPSVLHAETVAQWDCSAQFGQCYYDLAGAGYVLGEPCPVDVSRPRAPSDCRSTEWFECISAYSPERAHLAINCRCTPYEGTDCTCLSAQGVRVSAVCTDHEKLCGCAFPGILR